MAGLLDYLLNPIGSTVRDYGPNTVGGLLGFYRDQAPSQDNGGPQVDQMGNFTGINTSQSPFANGTTAVPFVSGASSPFSNGTTAVPYLTASPASNPTTASLENPIAVGDKYMMPRIGNPDQFVPQQVSTPPNATPTQGRMAAPQEQQTNQPLPPALGGRPSGFLDRINAGFQSAGNGGSILGALTGNYTDPQSMAQQNARAQYEALVPLVGRDKAILAVLNSEAGKSLFKGEFENPKTVEGVYAGALQDALKPGGGGPGQSPNDILGGVLRYKQGVAQAEQSGKTTGEKQAEVAATLPDTLSRTAEAIKQISEVRDHPAKGYRTGAFAVLPAIPGLQGKGVDFDERVAQLRSANFLAAAQQMRSLGALSNAEGAKIEGVQARLNQTKDTADFNQALSDMETILRRGYENLQKMAGNGNPTPYQMPVGESRQIGNGVTMRRTK